MRWRFNWYPAYRRTGARVTFISEDLREVAIRLPLNRATRNLHGSIYGGAMYSALDPLHAVLVAAHLGPDYHVWLKAARIDFRKPGRSDLFARARVHPHELEDIRTVLATTGKVDRDFTVSLADAHGTVSATAVLTVHARRRQEHERPMTSLGPP